MTHGAWFLTCDGLAVYRLAMLVTRDTILEPVRTKLRKRIHERGEQPIADIRPRMLLAWSHKSKLAWLLELISCPWCVSIYAAALVVALTALAPSIWQYPAMGLALSAAAGFLSDRS